jgi:hypothetical protein
MTISCCRNCVAPKRYPGCHGVCQEYLGEKAEYENRKAEYYKDEKLNVAINLERGKKVYNALKGYRASKCRGR